MWCRQLGLAAALLLVFPWTGLAQGDDYPVISPDNFTDLQSVTTITFDDYADVIGTVGNAWFALNGDATRIAVVNRQNALVVWDDSGVLIDSYIVVGGDGLAATVLDADFNGDGRMLVSVHVDGRAYYVAYRDLAGQTTSVMRLASMDVPLRVWVDDDDRAWLEVAPGNASDQYSVVAMPPHEQGVEEIDPEGLQTLASAPEGDQEAFIRVGRIQPPLAITVTEGGEVRRWHLETGALTAQAVLTGDLPVFGQTSADGQYFAWRDPQSASLHLLDFDTGEDRAIGGLDGLYIPFFMVSSPGDIIMAVNPGTDMVVWAWDVGTGKRHNLGNYRACSRQPDMARLSEDGTTLVIGCNKGLDIWRIAG